MAEPSQLRGPHCMDFRHAKMVTRSVTRGSGEPYRDGVPFASWFARLDLLLGGGLLCVAPLVFVRGGARPLRSTRRLRAAEGTRGLRSGQEKGLVVAFDFTRGLREA
jgi:hypothetical protein